MSKRNKSADKPAGNKAEAGLPAIAQQHRTLLDSAMDCIYLIDRKLNVLSVNRAGARLLGRKAKDITGQAIFDLFAPGIAAAYANNISKVFRTGESMHTEGMLGQKKGKKFAISTILSPIKDGDGRIISVMGITRDISKQKKAEEEIRKLNTNLENIVRERTANLRESECRFRETSMSVTDIAYSSIRHPDGSHSIDWIAGSVKSIFGYTENEFKSLGCWGKLVLEDDFSLFEKNVINLVPGASGECELRMRRKNGSVIRVVSYCRCVMPKDKAAPVRLYGGLTDVTRRKEVEEEFTRIFQNAPVMITISAVEDGRYLDVNEAFLRASGFSREEAVGRTSVELGWIAPEDRKRIVATLKTEGRALNMELTLRAKDGRAVNCLYSGVFINVAGKDRLLSLARDISDLKSTEKALQESEEKYRNIFSESPIAIELYDATGSLVMANKSCLDLFGVIDPGEIWGIKLFTDPNISQDNKEKLKRGEIVHYQASFDFEKVKALNLYRTKRSGQIWLDVLIAPLIKSLGGYLVQIQDITGSRKARQDLEQTNLKLKEAFEQLKRVEQQVIQVERLGALGQMASGIAHEFNNILVPIVGYADLLLSREDKLNDRQEAVSMIRMILSAAMDARETIRRLQDFARPHDDESREMVFFPELVENVVNLTRPKWREETGLKGITIKIKTEFQDMPAFHCNRSRMREVFTNLIFNAIDAMPQGGAITIRGRSIKPENVIELQVADTGAGMTDEVRRRLFEPFFTTKGSERSGLGIPITQGIISGYNGTIKYESAPGRGTTVFIRLPMAQTIVTPPAGLTAPASASKPLRILVIDDNEPVRQLITEYLKADGHTVELAADGHEGLGKASEGRFDLVITDSAMPGMSGSELAAAIKTTNQDIPIIMLTGFGDIMKRQNELPAGVDMVLAKPVTRDAFRDAIARLMEKKRPGSRSLTA
jgi:PAS domain S-box-containing protein